MNGWRWSEVLSALPRRLPGIRFEPQAGRLPEALPRMDVAVFVGFAASGPLHVPVAVEDIAQFRAIFGDEPILAWDEVRGEPARALLAPTIRTFFDNGGLRCWVVRVAGQNAAYNYFSLPGLLVYRPKARDAAPFPAFARARSQGSWSDGLRVSTALRLRPSQVSEGYRGGSDLILSEDGSIPAHGEILRFTFGREEYLLFATVESVQALR
jgi:hypothetical protein